MERRIRIERLFEAALDLAPAQRSEWLSAAAAGDDELRAEVEALLSAHALEHGMLDRPIARLGGMIDAPAHDRHIGAYRVIRELGRGGMGVVYLAERDDGQFRRRVALKLLRNSPDADELHRRFVAERQILASLDHPNIALLLDGGVSDGRLPYLVMEYVDGLPITVYCDRHRLPVTERLRLFLSVCAAVHHAHQNLIIHRDLKPSNIMVTASGQVKLLDFGIAKLLNPALGGLDQPVTRTEFRVMTPEYASPEQVRGDTLTTASDVYALGVVLYELLTGHPPYRLTRGSPKEVADIVCEREPELPSSRVAREQVVTREDGTVQLVTPEAVGASRELTPERLRGTLKGDLDAIVMMTLRKEPGRRYGSAEVLAADIQRYLDGLPISAHRGNRRYRAAKFIRRHQVEVMATVLVGASLVLGTGLASWQASAAKKERDRAASALSQAKEVTEFLLELFQAGDADSGIAGADVTARDLLQRGVVRADELGEHPVVQARLLDVMGQMQYSLGNYSEARGLLERAAAIRRTLPGANEMDLAETLIHLSWIHRSRNEIDEAHRLVTEALEIRRRLLPADDPLVAEAVYELGWLASGSEQERLYREAFDLLQRRDASPERRVRLLQGLSTNLRRQGRMTEAVATDREALRMAEREFGPEHFQTGYAMIHLADQVRDIEGDLATAERLYHHGMELVIRRFGENSSRLVHGLSSLAYLRSRLGDHAEAEQLYRRALAIRRAMTGPNHSDVASQMITLARYIERQDRLAEAEQLVEDAIDRLTRALGARHPTLATGLSQLAQIRLRQGRVDEADRLFQDAMSLTHTGGGTTLVHAAELRREYGVALVQQGRLAAAEEVLLESLQMLERAYENAQHPNVFETKRVLMELYRSSGKPELARLYEVPPGEFVSY
jgi:eukaryotic-like serine/threonine-protein kinase